ncbi:MAG TPA: dipeptidase [Tepidisphaeraceae bacterium]|jgi:acetylornithine deacetylase/succinyl-diaminopimelate desuccinylase-like protein
MLDQVLATVDSRRDESVEGLKDFLSIPSISAQPAHKEDMVRCAQSLAGTLGQMGLSASVMPTHGHPAVVARNEHRPGRPAILFYGHYDVQPPEPLDQWATPPFTPTIRKTEAGTDAVFARGAVDDKGQVWCHVEAIRAWQQNGGVPVNLIMLIEGEEEIGSDNLDRFVQQHKGELKADLAVISDTDQFDRGLPAITTALRGLCYAEVFITGPSHDLHSGQFGGAVPNPANVLVEVLGSLHTKSGKVNIPGFYDDVVKLTAAERKAWRKLPLTEKQFARSVGIPHGSGEAGFTSLERTWGRPTCDINGITTGYQGPGAKTVIPSTASAKVSMRLVAKQNPKKIQKLFEKTIRSRCPDNVKVRFEWHGASEPSLVPVDSKPTQLAIEALQIGFGTKPTFMRAGGSIPVVGLIKRVLGIETLLVGFGLPDDRVHSPNEKFDLDCLFGGTRTAAALYERLAKL